MKMLPEQIIDSRSAGVVHKKFVSSLHDPTDLNLMIVQGEIFSQSPAHIYLSSVGVGVCRDN
jgi:hypothetical protein